MRGEKLVGRLRIHPAQHLVLKRSWPGRPRRAWHGACIMQVSQLGKNFGDLLGGRKGLSAWRNKDRVSCNERLRVEASFLVPAQMLHQACSKICRKEETRVSMEGAQEGSYFDASSKLLHIGTTSPCLFPFWARPRLES